MTQQGDILSREKEYWEAREEFEWLNEESILDVVRAMPIKGDVLELCSGSGMFTRRVTADWSSYTCLDLSQTLLDTLKTQLPGIEIVQGNAQEPDFPENTFDTVLIFAGLHHLPDPDIAVASARRILKPGGHFAIFEPNEDCWYRKPMLKMKDILGLYTEDEKFLKPNDIMAFMQQAGFHQIRASYLTPAYNPYHLKTAFNKLLGGLMRMASRVSDAPSWQSFFILDGQK